MRCIRKECFRRIRLRLPLFGKRAIIWHLMFSAANLARQSLIVVFMSSACQVVYVLSIFQLALTVHFANVYAGLPNL